MKFRSIALIAAVVIGATWLTACTPTVNDNASKQASQESTFSSADIMFFQMMIPHHQQAMDLGTLAETRASNPEVKTLAAQIKSEQTPEVSQMKSWIDSAGADLNMGHEMGMDGILTDAEITALKAATGIEFDKLYLEGMIGHHEGAIIMAKQVLDSKNAEVRALAEGIIASQTEQITYMKELLKSLG